MSSDIAISRSGSTLHIRFARAAKRNALTVPMYAAMADALTAAETDGTLSVLFSGEGAGFCAGNDLADFVQNPPQGPEAPVHRFLTALAHSTRVLIAAVQGRAVGVGTTMLLHCDFVVLDPDAELRMPFTDLALVPEAGSSLLVPALVGPQRAAALLLLGEAVPAARALELGFATKIAAPGEALREAEAIATALEAKPRSAILATKALMRSPARDLESRMAEESAAFAAQLRTPELAAIVAGFFAARGKAA